MPILDHEPKFEAALKNAEHYKALGIDSVSLWNELDESLPWDRATCKEGGSFRLGCSVSTHFKAEVGGLEFTWCVDWEPRSANGSGSLQVDFERAKAIMAKLPSDSRTALAEQFRQIITTLDEELARNREWVAAQTHRRDALLQVVGAYVATT